jgi:hypothetical protein
VRDLAAQIAGDWSELAQAQAEIKRLKLIIQRLQCTQFGRRSKRMSSLYRQRQIFARRFRVSTLANWVGRITASRACNGTSHQGTVLESRFDPVISFET